MTEDSLMQFMKPKGTTTVQIPPEASTCSSPKKDSHSSSKFVGYIRKDLCSVENGVLELLKSDERCRNDDKYLIWKYIREIDGIKAFIPFNDFDRMTSFESIRRCRQKIQSKGDYKPTDTTIVQKRERGRKAYRKYALSDRDD